IDGEPQGGDTFSIKRQPDQEKRSLLNTVSDLRKALLSAEDTPAGNLAIRDAVGVAISNLDSSNSQILTGQGRIGARMNVAESTETFIDDVTLVNTAVISQIQDLDYPEALSRLTLQSTIMD
ncbi:flagellar biosynthesis protein FlgL, partial [Pseudomonas aeruginosa]|nr:flagellar biosynthesis protein FlgL [Pseudomonas aeruginosa]